MKTIKTICGAAILCWGFKSYSGILVGNGAGLAEQNIQFIYMLLPKIISECTALPIQCALTSYEQAELFKIRAVVYQNYSLSGRIQFVSEKQNPGFFTTSSTENNRIAKTGLNAQSPIFFNVDELYDSNGRPAMDFAGLTAILIHEIGHQTGETSHAKLDILGAKMRIFLSFQFTSFDYSFQNSQNVEINVINYPMPAPIGDVYLSIKNGASMQLTALIMPKLNCDSADEVLVGFNLTNGHWNHVDNGANLIDFEAWLQVFCRASSALGGDLRTISRDLVTRVGDDGKVVSVEVH